MFRRTLTTLVLLAITLLPAWGRGASGPPAALTDATAAWTAANPVVHLGYDPEWPPFTIRTADSAAGIDIDLVTAAFRHAGITVEWDHATSWTEALNRLRNGRTLGVVSIAQTPERLREFAFSKPYHSFPVALVTRADAPFLVGLHALTGRRVALPADYATTEALPSVAPGSEIVLTRTQEDSLLSVARGEADATYSNLANAAYIIRTRGLSNLKIAGLARERFDLCIATLPANRPLIDAFEAGFAAMPEPLVEATIARWIHVAYDDGLLWRQIAPWVIPSTTAVLISGGVALWWIRRLRRFSRETTAAVNMTAHDLRNPITAVRIQAELLALEPGPAGEHGRAILSACDRVIDELQELVDTASLEAGSQRLKLHALSLHPLLTQALDAVRSAATSKRLRLVAAPPPPGLRVLADQAKLRRILENLLSNAVKFTPVAGTIEVAVDARPLEVVLRVADSGLGFSRHDRRRLFRPFARLSSRPTAGESSTGLGLWVAQRLARAMRGRITVGPKSGGGAVLFVHLRRAPDGDPGLDRETGP